jgi:4-amino-4-deoxy-L-arabinose transferase-like glycosyltransferase
VVGLLLLQFLVRTFNITLQDPYIDEGFHVVRAAHIWDFAQHPGRFSHGKVLVYFWMGAFRLTPETALHVARTSIALFSLLTGAALYAVARRLYGHTTGVVALALYVILPLAYFYERMAMADPLAAGFSALVAWRSLIFARRPTLREGAWIGALLALATLAKLTMGLLPLLPVVAVVIFRERDGAESPTLRTYLLPLIVAAGVMALIWAPMLIPAGIAQTNGDPFLLVDSFNLRGSDPEPATPDQYITGWLPLITDVTSRGFLVACAVAWIGQVLPVQSRRTQRGARYLFAWLALIVLLPVAAARLITLRYFMAASGPLVILVARGVVLVWRGDFIPHPLGGVNSLTVGAGFQTCPGRVTDPPLQKNQPNAQDSCDLSAPKPFTGRGSGGGVDIRRLPALLTIATRLALLALIAAWLVTFALPFLWTEWHDPLDLPLHGTNRTEYISGSLSADDGVRAAAVTINQIEPGAPIYANWSLCHMLYFYLDREIECLSLDHPLRDLRNSLNRDLVQPDDMAYLALTGYKPFFETIQGVCWQEVASHDRPRIIRPVGIWRFWRGAC